MTMSTNGQQAAHDHGIDNGQSSDDMDVEPQHNSENGNGNPLDKEGIPPSSGKGMYQVTAPRPPINADASAATLKRYAINNSAHIRAGTAVVY